MINSQHVAALVPARGGSTTIPKKNLVDLGGKPLVAWPIQTAKETKEIDSVYVTTDSPDIADAGREYGAEIIDRPDELAGDSSLVIDAVKHAVEYVDDASYMVLLEPTCPFRAPSDVSECLALLAEGYDSVGTFTEAEVNPHRTWKISDNEATPFIEGANPWKPRQKLPKAYQLNGGCYAFDTDAAESASGPGLLFGDSASVTMPAERSVDIDTPLDLTVARTIVENQEVANR